jgi:hypothetical protein
MLPQGQYALQCNGERETRTFLPGETYDLDLRPGRALDFEVSKTTAADGEVTIAVTARGSGAHSFALRTGNLKLDGARKQITLQPGVVGHAEWQARIDSAKTSWVAIVVPDEVLARRKEVRGAIWDPQKN